MVVTGSNCDVLIAGGGPAGAALALALRASALRISVLETRAGSLAADDDPRPVALSHGSRLVLERLGVWKALEPVTAIARIHISQRGGFGRVELDAAEARLPALGYVVDYTRLAGLLSELVQGGWCDYLPGAAVTRLSAEAGAAAIDVRTERGERRITASLLVVADGGTQAGSDEMRTVDYRQVAVTARVTSTAAHANVAYERFTSDGPLALLPSGDRLALVWSTTPEHAQQLCAAPEAAFLAALQRAFGGRLGRFIAAERRGMFPLALRIARRTQTPRVVRIGNAAQTLHPVAGQGLNLALRDAWELAAEFQRAPRENIGTPEFLARYARRRRVDRTGGIWFTDNLVRIFSSDLAPLRFARGLGLTALAALPPARDFLVRRMTFGTRG